VRANTVQSTRRRGGVGGSLRRGTGEARPYGGTLIWRGVSSQHRLRLQKASSLHLDLDDGDEMFFRNAC
jgi:hypothetical protein